MGQNWSVRDGHRPATNCQSGRPSEAAGAHQSPRRRDRAGIGGAAATRAAVAKECDGLPVALAIVGDGNREAVKSPATGRAGATNKPAGSSSSDRLHVFGPGRVY